MISKLRFSLFAVIMLVLLGFGFHDQAKGQPGQDLQFCPGVEISNGWLQTRISPDPAAPPDFSAALIGTVEGFNGNAVAGLDWQHVDISPLFFDIVDGGVFGNLGFVKPTNRTGGQLVTWWTQNEGRNTSVQITENLGAWIGVHVHIFDSNCVEIRDFCDVYSPFDTHVYDLGDLVTNDGQTPDDSILQDREGFMTVTVVGVEEFFSDLDTGCPDSDQAVDYNWLAGNTYIVDPDDYMYGANMYARIGVCVDELLPFVNLVEDGSFQNGNFENEFGSLVWNLRQSGDPVLAGVINEDGISPQVSPPACDDPDNPDCLLPGADTYMAYVASDPVQGGSSFYNAADNLSLPDPDMSLISNGFETNVTILESNTYVADGSNTLTYDLSFLAPGLATELLDCENFALVCTVDKDAVNPFFVDCDCYNRNGVGSSPTGGPCQALASSVATARGIGPILFEGGSSSFVGGSLSVPSGSFSVQVITGQDLDNGACNSASTTPGFRTATGALVDNFAVLEEDLVCDEEFVGFNFLNGVFSFYIPWVPDEFAGQFNVLAGNEGNAGADVVHINFADQYLPNYTPQAAFINAAVAIYDEDETPSSCGDANVCFVRLGIDADIVISDEFTPASPSASPTATPTLGPVSPTPTPTATSRPRGSSSSCAITGPVQLGTAMANVLIPLIPLAFVFGIRAVRRRKK